jgi:hypothetical protein
VIQAMDPSSLQTETETFSCLCTLDNASGQWRAWAVFEGDGQAGDARRRVEVPGSFLGIRDARDAVIAWVGQQRGECAAD